MTASKLGRLGVGGAVVIIGALAFGVPLRTILSFGLLLACPLMMLGMHGGHGHGGRDHADRAGLDSGPERHEH